MSGIRPLPAEILNQITAANYQAITVQSELQGAGINDELVQKVIAGFLQFSTLIENLQEIWKKSETDMKKVCEWVSTQQVQIDELTENNQPLVDSYGKLQTSERKLQTAYNKGLVALDQKDTTILDLRREITQLKAAIASS